MPCKKGELHYFFRKIWQKNEIILEAVRLNLCRRFICFILTPICMNSILLRSASATVMALVLFALPFTTSAQSEEVSFQTEEWSALRVIRSFQNTGGSASIYFENESVSESGFDFPAFFSHPCYEPIGEHLMDSCQRRYGVYGNLKMASTSVVFRNLLAEKFGSGILSLLGTASADFTEQEAEDAAQEALDSDTVSFYDDIRARRIRLWDICNERFPSKPAACYQDNIRLLLMQDVEISGHVYPH